MVEKHPVCRCLLQTGCSFCHSYSAYKKIRPWQEYMSRTDTVPRCHLGSGETPCSRRNTNIFPATDVCLTSQNTRLLPFLAPSATHLTVCVLPAFTVPARCKCTITSLLPLLRFYGRYIIMSFIISSLYLYVNTLFSHQSKKVCSQTLYFSFVSFLLQESIQCVKNT